MRLDQAVAVDAQAIAYRADYLGGAEIAGDDARRNDAGADRICEIVAGADRHRRADRQAG